MGKEDEAGGTQTPLHEHPRFKALVGEKNDLAARVAQLEGELKGLEQKAATADTLAQQLRDAQARAETAEGRFDTYKAITGAGFTDPDDVEAFEWQYGKLPEEGRPALADWVQGLVADPTKAPSVLRRAIEARGADGAATTAAATQAGGEQAGAQAAGAAAAAAAGAQGAAVGGQRGGTPPAANAGTRQATGAPGTWTAEQVAAMKPDEFLQHLPAISAATGVDFSGLAQVAGLAPAGAPAQGAQATGGHNAGESA